MKVVSKTTQTVKRRPAETTGIGAAVVALLALFGLDLSEDQAAALLVLVGLLPAVVTWFKDR
jgi:hypothetical protein